MKAKVWNKNTFDLKEKFKGEDVVIPAGKYVEMEFFDAHEFKGQYKPITLGPDEQPTRESFKIIEIEKIADDEDPVVDIMAHKCMSCGKSYESGPVLKAHTETAHASQETLTLPDVDSKIRGRQKKAS